MDIAVLSLWGLRFGLVLLALGILLPDRNRRSLFHRVVGAFGRGASRSSAAQAGRMAAFIRWVEQISETSMLRHFLLRPGTPEYEKLAMRIQKAGGLGGITPNTIQVFRLLLPPLAFVLLSGWYLIRLRVRTVTLSSPAAESNAFYPIAGFLQPEFLTATPTFSVVTLLLILVFSALLYYLPDLVIAYQIRERTRQMKRELPIVESFILLMLESEQYSVYEILRTIMDTTKFFRPYIMTCLNEYFLDPNRAIQNMADRVGDDEFQTVCNALKQVVGTEREVTAQFLRQHLDQVRRLQQLQREAQIKRKPMYYVILLALPLTCTVIIWFYPWLIRAIRSLSMVL